MDLNTLVSQFPSIIKLVSGLAYLIGLGLVLKSIKEFKVFGEEKTRDAPPRSLKPAITYLLVGVALVFSPETIAIAMQTTFGSSSILAYEGAASQFGGVQFMQAFLYFVQVIGFVSFIRGWVMLAKLVHGATQERSYSMALTHIIGGIFAMNIQMTISILSASFGVA